MPSVQIKYYAALFLLPWLAISAEAHAGDRVYPVSYLTDKMLAEIQLDDGRIDEWYELAGEPTMTLLDFTDAVEQSAPNPADLDFRIWVAWHDEPARFYVAFVASDDQYKNSHDYSGDQSTGRDVIILNDSIVLGIDGDHSGGVGAVNSTPLEEWDELTGRTQYYEAIARTPEGPILDEPGIRHQTGELAWTVLLPYADGGGGVAGEAPVISVIELYVTPFDRWKGWHSPGEIMVSDLTAGQIIGFAIAVKDRDPSEYGITWVPEAMQDQPDSRTSDIMFLRGDRFLDGLLLPAGPAGPGDSAVEPVSWGRIKASLEFE